MTLQVQLDGLSKVVLDLKEQQEGLHSTVISRHIFLMLVEALVMAAVFMTCNRSPGQMVATVSGQTRTTTSDRSSGRRCVVAPAIASSSAIQQLRRNSDSSIKPLTYEGAMEESKERRKSSTEAPTSSGKSHNIFHILGREICA